MANARRDKSGWIRCSVCGHKLGRAVGKWSDENVMPALEIKCHSCKSLVYIMVGSKGLREDSGE